MNISIKIDEPKEDDRKNRWNMLLLSLESLAQECDDVTPDRRASWSINSQKGLPFLEKALAKIAHDKFAYKISICDLDDEGAGVWHRSF